MENLTYNELRKEVSNDQYIHEDIRKEVAGDKEIHNGIVYNILAARGIQYSDDVFLTQEGPTIQKKNDVEKNMLRKVIKHTIKQDSQIHYDLTNNKVKTLDEALRN